MNDSLLWLLGMVVAVGVILTLIGAAVGAVFGTSAVWWLLKLAVALLW